MGAVVADNRRGTAPSQREACESGFGAKTGTIKTPGGVLSRLGRGHGSAANTDGWPMKILLVEAERREARFVARALHEQAYAVDVAEGGKRALKLASEIDYDSILLDWRLPQLDGIQLCQELRCWRVNSPVLMLTSRAPVKQRVKWLEAGAD